MKLYWGSSCGDTGCRGRHFGGRSKESMDLLAIGLNSPALSSLRI
jgi:hypothetical protein